MAKVAILMGSKSDFPVVRPAAEALKKFGVETEVRVISAHRTPDEAHAFAENAEKNGVEVIVCAAGKAAQEVFGKQLFKGFTPGETEQYKVLFDKMCENAAEGLAETERMN